MYNFNILEKVVIESLSEAPKTIEKLCDDTNLNTVVIENTIMSLLTIGAIKKELHIYQMSSTIPDELKSALHSEKEKRKSMLELSETILINSNNNFKFYKVNMTEREERILNGLLYNVESFLKDLKTKKTKDETLAEQKILFWGEENYGKVINNILN